MRYYDDTGSAPSDEEIHGDTLQASGGFADEEWPRQDADAFPLEPPLSDEEWAEMEEQFTAHSATAFDPTFPATIEAAAAVP